MRKLRGRELLLGIALPAGISVIILAVGVFGLILPEFEATLLEQRRGAVQDQVKSAWSIVQRHYHRAETGEITVSEAKRRAADALRNARYGPDQGGYFWVLDLEGQILVHPYRSDLEGHVQLDLQDEQGTHIIRESIAAAKRGGGFVEYYWAKPGDDQGPHQKLTYVRPFEPWGWAIATGVYLDDVRAETSRLTSRAYIILFGVLGVVGVMLLVLVGRSVHVERARRDAEEARADSEAKYRMIVEHQQDIVVKIDRVGQLMYVSPRFTEVFGLSEDQALGSSFLDLVTQEDQAVFVRALDRIQQPPHSAFVEQRVKTVDGVRWFSWRNQAVLDRSGKVEAIICSGGDITGRRTAEMAVRASEEHLRSLFRVAPMGIGVIDHLKIHKVNDSLCRMLGYERDELIGEHSRILYDSDQSYRHDIKAFRRQLKQDRAADLETRWRRKDGTAVDVLLSGTYDEARDDIRRVIFTVVDITERKSLEAQLRQSQKMEAIGQLAGGVAHDFNNQLTIIRGYCDLMLDDGRMPASIREQLTHVDNAAARAGRLTSQLLAFSRKQVLRPEVIDLAEVISEMHKPLARMVGEEIVLSFSQQDPVTTCKLDRSQLEQAVINLVVNARDAMDQGGALEMTVSHRSIADDSGEIAPGNYVCLSVHDTGTGMDAHTRQHLFEPFFTTKDVGKGTGLGLSMVYGFVSQSDGTIIVDSTPGVGTTFELYFPAVGASVAANAVAPRQQAPRGRETILVVEDEPGVRKLIARVLTDVGYEVIETETTEEALDVGLDLAREIDMLVADVVMPGCSGPELAAQIIEKRPGLSVLYVSGYVRGVAVRRGLIDAYANILSKPFSPHELAGAVRECLDQNEPRPQEVSGNGPAGPRA